MRGAVTTGDPANDLRLAEHQAFAMLQTAYRRLAGISFHHDQRRKERLARLDQMKVNWWHALQERDAAEGILKSCGGGESRPADCSGSASAPPPSSSPRGAGVAPGPQVHVEARP